MSTPIPTVASATLTMMSATEVAALVAGLNDAQTKINVMRTALAYSTVAQLKQRLGGMQSDVINALALIASAPTLPPLTDSAGDVLLDSVGDVLYGSVPGITKP